MPYVAIFVALSLVAPIRVLSEETPLEKGIALLTEKRYEDALVALKEASKETPNDALTSLWLGLALQATDQPHEAMAAWRVTFGHAKWEPYGDTLRGYGWWRLGDTNYAKRTFEEAFVNLKDSAKITFKPAKDALARLESGGAVPPFSQWAERVHLQEATKKALSFEGEDAPSARQEPTPAKPLKAAPKPEKKEEKALPKGANVKPVAGKWIGVRTKGGYNDGKVMFTVSADGKRISDVVFIGHWYDRERRHTEPVTTGPEGTYAIKSGGWGGLQTNSKAGFGWEFEGRLLNARLAKGKFRGYAAGVYDTGTVEWTAKPVK